MNLLSLADWSGDQIKETNDLALQIKQHPDRYSQALAGRVLLMFFEKPSLRTRVSFEAAMLQMGGHAIFYDLGTSPWGVGKETTADTARTASRYVHGIMARLFSRKHIQELADHATVPVINGLTDFEHPCQAMGDLMTIQEKKGRLQGLKLTYVGDGNNNVTHSLLDGCGKMGLNMTVGCPEDSTYHPGATVLERARRFSQETGARIEVVHDAKESVSGADVIYTDTWMSYHIPAEEREKRFQMLEPFKVTPDLMKWANPDAIFMHCLPAQRGVEMTADVLDGPQSVVFDQAENRLHSEKAILLTLLFGNRGEAPIEGQN
jgi:ornithine carbamoyltransferase